MRFFRRLISLSDPLSTLQSPLTGVKGVWILCQLFVTKTFLLHSSIKLCRKRNFFFKNLHFFLYLKFYSNNKNNISPFDTSLVRGPCFVWYIKGTFRVSVPVSSPVTDLPLCQERCRGSPGVFSCLGPGSCTEFVMEVTVSGLRRSLVFSRESDVRSVGDT